MSLSSSYNREAAVNYAHKWAYGRNPIYYNYDKLGGDCTNFASQCLHAGGCIMDFRPTFGWYYRNANSKAPAWTGVDYFYNFLTRAKTLVGPVARECEIGELMAGDIVQLSFTGGSFQHSPVVVAASRPKTTDDVLVAAHTYDTDYRPVSTYPYEKIRFLHIESANGL